MGRVRQGMGRGVSRQKEGSLPLRNKGERERFKQLIFFELIYNVKQLILMCISGDTFITSAQISSQILQKPASYFFSNLQI